MNSSDNTPLSTDIFRWHGARSYAGGLISFVALSMSSHAVTLSWVPAGSGDWDQTTLNWDPDGAGPMGPQIWGQRDVAVFDNPAGGEINVVGPIEASRVIFGTNGYTVSGDALTMIEQAPGDFLDFVADAGITGTIRSEINSPSDIWINFFGETGTIIFESENSYLGKTSVRGGTLELQGSVASTVIDIETNATLRLAGNERLNDDAVVTSGALAPGGTVTLGGDETIGTYNGIGSDLNGAGTLTADTYNLSDGASTDAGANLGAGQLNSGPGNVTLGGDAAAEDVNVNDGTLNVNGQLTGVTDLEIAPTATVNLGSDERINDSGVINNTGTLNLGGTETVDTVNSTGTVGGTGTVVASGDINLNDGHRSLNGTSLETVNNIVSNGTVTIDGTAGSVLPADNASLNAGVIDLQSGTMLLDGLVLNDNAIIEVRGGATLVSGSADRVANGATVNNMGTWTLGGSDTIGEINMQGLLNGVGTLTAGTYNLSNGALLANGANFGTGTLNSGPGIVTLNGNAGAGLVNLNSGMLNLNGQLTGVTNLNILNGAVLLSGAADRVADTAEVNLANGGTWTLNGNDTINELIASGQIDGTGTLTASQYTLSNGAVTIVGANLGGGQLNSGPGIVTLGGDAAAEDVNVTGGTLNLNGQLTGVTDLAIANGSVVILGSTERINDGSVVNNSGLLNLAGNETVTTYNADGGSLNNAGLLQADTYNLSNGATTAAGSDLGTGQLNSGPGMVTLDGDAAAEDVNVTGGTLNLNGELTGVTDLSVASGSEVNLGSAERVNDASVVNNSGSINLSGTETVTTYNADGGSLNDAGLLQADTYNLSNGASTAADSDLGTGQLNSGPGVVTVNGDAAAEDVNVTDGTLNLNGELTGVTDLEIASTATVNLGSDERVNDAAVVNNSGNLNLGGTETVDTVNSTGTVGGAGTLVASGDINLNDGHRSLNGASLQTANSIVSNGTVTIDGTAGSVLPADNASLNASVVNLQSGTMLLNGLVLNDATTIQVLSGATLVSGSADRVANGAIVNNMGTWTLGGNDAIGEINMQGLLNGTGTLTAGTYNLSNGALLANGANFGTGTLNSGPGIVTLNGNVGAGLVNLNSGMLNLNGQLTGVTNLNILNGAVLLSGAADRVADTAEVNLANGGTWTLNGNDTINELIASGQIDGAGTLTASQYTLSNGAVTIVGANLGGGQLNSGPGIVTLGGDAAAEDVNVTGGTLNLNGQLTGVTDLAIANGSAVILGSTERINDASVVNNSGTLNLGGSETVATYNADGGSLNDAGLLQADTYNLSNGASTAADADLGTGQLNSGPGIVTVNGDAAAEDVNVTGGTLNLNGELTGVTDLSVATGSEVTLGSAERINDASVVNNSGAINLGGTETVDTYNADAGSLNDAGLLQAGTYNLSNGATTATDSDLGSGQLNSGPGFVTVNGDAAAEDVNVTSGTLNLNGQLTQVTDLFVATGSEVNLGSAERVNDASVVNNFGAMNLAGTETVTTYNSNSATLSGNGLLQAAVYNLGDGSITSALANLGTGELNSGPGAIILNGSTNADFINVNPGSFTTNGSVLNPNGTITLTTGSTWFVNGAYTYDNLRGLGTVDPGGVNGNTFSNFGNLRPGNSNIGALNIADDYVEGGTFHGELDPTNIGGAFLRSDKLLVNGATRLDPSSVLRVTGINGLSSSDVMIGNRFNLISSDAGIDGAFGEITDGNNRGPGGRSIDSQFLFDIGTGDLVGLGLTGNQTSADYTGINSNQISILDSFTDNATDAAGNFDSGDSGAGTILNNLLNNGAPGDIANRLNTLDAMSPEGYAGSIDYTLHSVRSYTRNVLTAAPILVNSKFEVVAGWNNFGVASSASQNNQDYDLSSNSGYVGMRSKVNDKLTAGGFIAFDGGEVSGPRVKLDADGFLFGGAFNYAPDGAVGNWFYRGSLSYGSYSFSGNRQGFLSELSSSDFDGSALQLGFSVDHLAYQKDGLRIMPGAALNFISASNDGFTETGGIDALTIEGQDQNALFLDLMMRASYQQPGSQLTLSGELGYQLNLIESERDVTASLASGGGTFDVTAPGLGSGALVVGLGISYDVTEQFQIDLSYRGEFRGDSDTYSGVNLGFAAKF